MLLNFPISPLNRETPNPKNLRAFVPWRPIVLQVAVWRDDSHVKPPRRDEDVLD